MSRTKRMTWGLCAAVAGSVIAMQAMGDGDTVEKMSPKQPSSTQRSAEAIKADLTTTIAKLHEVLPSPKLIGDAKFRKENAEKVLPVLKHTADLFTELAETQSGPSRAGILEGRTTVLGFAAGLGDQNAVKILTDLAASKDADEARSAKSKLVMGNWLKNSDNAKAQQAVLDDYTVVAKANPEDDTVAETLSMMSQFGPANDEMSKKAIEVIKTTLKGEAAEQILAQVEADRVKQEMVGKPLSLAGRTTTDGKFDTTSLKGKVVMLDFWATWCGPCREELPRVKALYKTYHEKGLEIVGVDCDSSDDEVNSFTKENEMPWTQMREQSQGERSPWHPLATKYKVNGIPTMFLIDKNGVLRYVDAREDTEEKIKKLLDEPEAKKTETPAK